MNDKKRPLNLTVSDQVRHALQYVADENGLTISQLVRFLAIKVTDNPGLFGLRESKPREKDTK